MNLLALAFKLLRRIDSLPAGLLAQALGRLADVVEPAGCELLIGVDNFFVDQRLLIGLKPDLMTGTARVVPTPGSGLQSGVEGRERARPLDEAVNVIMAVLAPLMSQQTGDAGEGGADATAQVIEDAVLVLGCAGENIAAEVHRDRNGAAS